MSDEWKIPPKGKGHNNHHLDPERIHLFDDILEPEESSHDHHKLIIDDLVKTVIVRGHPRKHAKEDSSDESFQSLEHLPRHKDHKEHKGKKKHYSFGALDDKFDIPIRDYKSDDDLENGFNHKKGHGKKTAKHFVFEGHHEPEHKHHDKKVEHPGKGHLHPHHTLNAWSDFDFKVVPQHKQKKHDEEEDEEDDDDDSMDEDDDTDDTEDDSDDDSAETEDEKELKEWLKQSKNTLKHRKDDLLKTLEKEQRNMKSKGFKLNYPVDKSETNFIDNLLDHDSPISPHHKRISEFDLHVFKELIKKEKDRDEMLASLMSNRGEINFKPGSPTRRLFLGEPSTVSEIIGQVKDPQEVIKEEFSDDGVYDNSRISVMPLVHHSGIKDVSVEPFSTAEKLVWDWQAIALGSAVAACVLFFVVITAYIILQSRQWKKPKVSYISDMEEMSARKSLMSSHVESGTVEAHPTHQYLEQLIAMDKLPSIKEEVKRKS